MWARGDSWAGVHASSNYDPPSTGFRSLSASWSIDVQVIVWAWCPSSSDTGADIGDYDQVNVTPYVAAFNVDLQDNSSGGWAVPNSFQPAFQLSSQDQACTPSGAGYAAQETVTLNETFVVQTYAWMSSLYDYELRAAIQFSFWEVSYSSAYTNAGYLGAGASYAAATLNFISIS